MNLPQEILDFLSLANSSFSSVNSIELYKILNTHKFIQKYKSQIIFNDYVCETCFETLDVIMFLDYKMVCLTCDEMIIKKVLE